MPKLVSLTHPSWQNSVGGISDFRVLVKFLINKNCHSFRISNDIGTKLGPVTEFDRKKTTASKKIWRWRCVGKLWRHFHYIFPNVVWFKGICNPDSKQMVYNFYILINRNFFILQKLKSIYNTDLILLLWVKVLFLPKMLFFAKKKISAKLRGSWYLKVHFLKLKTCEYSRAKFQISSNILTSFRQG